MLLESQPLDPKISEKFDLESKREIEAMQEHNIESQRIGTMFDDISDDSGKRKIGFKICLDRKWQKIKGAYYDFKYTLRNHVKWHKTMREIRPWEGFDGFIRVMRTHLQDYIICEEKYGSSEEEYKHQKIASVKETLALLERMNDPQGYSDRRRDEVESRYPKYKRLITKYKKGGTGCSGNFVEQGSGWVGKESGNNPREGYFEFVDGKFKLADSPDQCETDRLLSELRQYREELNNAYKQAEADSDKDFDRLGQLLKENLYKWWD